MGRSGYSDDCDNLGLWRGAVERAIAGKRGQAFLREMAAALDAMPVKELITDEIVRADGGVCAIGAVAVSRGEDVSNVDPHNSYHVADRFGIARALAREIVYVNDECGERWDGAKAIYETPAERWTRVRKWVDEQLRSNSPAAREGGRE